MNKTVVQHHGGSPLSERKKGLSPVKCSQTNVDSLRGSLLTEESGLYSVVHTNSYKTLTNDDVIATSSMELLLQRPPQIMATREGDRFLHPIISTFLSCLYSFR